MNKICYWDSETNSQKERDATVEENAEIEARKAAANDLTPIKLHLAAQIDSKIALIIEKWARFQMGYAKREAAARAYKAAGYTGDATRWVTSFADPAGKTAREAADIIIGQADGMALALENIEALRMEKYLIIRATTKAIAESEFARINTGIDAIVNSLS